MNEKKTYTITRTRQNGQGNLLFTHVRAETKAKALEQGTKILMKLTKDDWDFTQPFITEIN